MEHAHQPVLLNETIAALEVRPGGLYIDCTVGAGGHTAAILESCSPGGRVLGLDVDPEALEIAKTALSKYGESVRLVNANFNRLEEVCSRHQFGPVDGVLFDLGMSSLQLADKKRGFSFQHEAPLDMRFAPDQDVTAARIVNEYPEKELAALIRTYGEERRSRRIARYIVQNRPLRTTLQLAQVITRAFNGERGRIHPATRTFQALRIAVNREIDNLRAALGQAVRLLSQGGRLAVISFHSLEDREVKEFMSREAKGCLCPPHTPACTCGHTPRLRLVTRKVIKPTENEIAANPRSRSARMRVAQRIFEAE